MTITFLLLQPEVIHALQDAASTRGIQLVQGFYISKTGSLTGRVHLASTVQTLRLFQFPTWL